MRLALIAALLIAAPLQAQAIGDCRFKTQPPVTLKTMGPCDFDAAALRFAGDPLRQARCLLAPVRAVGRIGAPLPELPLALAQRIGRADNLPDAAALKTFFEARGLAMDLDRPLARANDNDPASPAAGYLVIHDTSSPNFRTRAFPRDIDTDSSINNLKRYACANRIERAHVFINRRGEMFLPHDFDVPWRATKFEMATNFDGRLKGLFLHVELVQPRRRHPHYRGDNDYLAPSPGFTAAQYDALALVYAAASRRAGVWLIPAYHAVLDEGIADKHDDPQNFDLDAFAASLTRLLDRMAARR